MALRARAATVSSCTTAPCMDRMRLCVESCLISSDVEDEEEGQFSQIEDLGCLVYFYLDTWDIGACEIARGLVMMQCLLSS